jgi:hypothetical protein
MAVEKLSVSVPTDVAALIRARAAEAEQSVSAWLTDAAREKAAATDQRAAALAAAEELLSEAIAVHGPPTRVDVAWVAGVLQSAGLAAAPADDVRAAG